VTSLEQMTGRKLPPRMSSAVTEHSPTEPLPQSKSTVGTPRTALVTRADTPPSTGSPCTGVIRTPATPRPLKALITGLPVERIITRAHSKRISPGLKRAFGALHDLGVARNSDVEYDHAHRQTLARSQLASGRVANEACGANDLEDAPAGMRRDYVSVIEDV
jgi:hypothetical protein